MPATLRTSLFPALVLMPLLLSGASAGGAVPACVGVIGGDGTFEGYCLTHEDCVGLFYDVQNGGTSNGFGWGVLCSNGAVCSLDWDTRQGYSYRSCLV